MAFSEKNWINKRNKEMSEEEEEEEIEQIKRLIDEMLTLNDEVIEKKKILDNKLEKIKSYMLRTQEYMIKAEEGFTSLKFQHRTNLDLDLLREEIADIKKYEKKSEIVILNKSRYPSG